MLVMQYAEKGYLQRPRVVANSKFSHHQNSLDLQTAHPKIVYLLF